MVVQVTTLFVVHFTVAVKVWLPPRGTETLAGLTVTAMAVKLYGLAAVPPGVVRVMGAVTIPTGMTVVTEVGLTTVKSASRSPNFTDVVPVKFVPVSVTVPPIAPLVGEKLVMVGTGTMVKTEALEAVPSAVVTLINPVAAPLGMTAVMDVGLTTVKLVAAVVPNLTTVAPARSVPVKVTDMPTPPLEGVMLVSVGAATTVKLEPLTPVPPGVVTLMAPVVAPAGTAAVIEVALTTVKLLADRPLNITAVAPVKSVPVRATLVPATPLVGEKLESAGGRFTESPAAALVTLPWELVTVTVNTAPWSEATVAGVE